MRARITAVTRLDAAVAASLRGGAPVVLAVSGGRDSMVLLDAAARMGLGAPRPLVATFDHRTGPSAAEAAHFVASQAAARGMECVLGRAGARHSTEQGWRAERWRFLREVAAARAAAIATAHTLDDQIETVFIRALRDAGARGLAGLFARSDVLRPLLPFGRDDVAAAAADRGVRYLEDPTNVSLRHLRNRVRIDLLPAIARVRPQFPDELLGIAQSAAAWRGALAAIVDDFDLLFLNEGTIRIAAELLQGYDAASLHVLWPEVAARAGVTMDRRGTERAAEFTIQRLVASGGRSPRALARRGRERRGGRGQVIQLSGGAEIEFVGGAFILRRA